MKFCPVGIVLYLEGMRKGMTRLIVVFFATALGTLLITPSYNLASLYQHIIQSNFQTCFNNSGISSSSVRDDCNYCVLTDAAIFCPPEPLTLKARFIYTSVSLELKLTHNPFFLWPVPLHLGWTPIRYKEFQAQHKVYSCIGFCSRLSFYNVVLFRFIFVKKRLILSHKLWGSKQHVLAAPPCLLYTNKRCVLNEIYKFSLTQLHYIKYN